MSFVVKKKVIIIALMDWIPVFLKLTLKTNVKKLFSST